MRQINIMAHVFFGLVRDGLLALPVLVVIFVIGNLILSMPWWEAWYHALVDSVIFWCAYLVFLTVMIYRKWSRSRDALIEEYLFYLGLSLFVLGGIKDLVTGMSMWEALYRGLSYAAFLWFPAAVLCGIRLYKCWKGSCHAAD